MNRLTPIQDLPLSARTRNALKNDSMQTLADLIERCIDRWDDTRYRLLWVPNLGKISEAEIRTFLEPFIAEIRGQENDAEFIEWCRRNRPVLDLLRKGLIS